MPPKKTWSPSKRFYLYLTAFVLIVITVDTYQKTVQVTQRKGQIAIIDPLSGSDETGFTEQCCELFLSEGYEVDITKGAEVTVDKLKQIPKDYETLICGFTAASSMTVSGSSPLKDMTPPHMFWSKLTVTFT